MQISKVYGITIAKQAHIYCRNGEHFILSANVKEFHWLVENYLLAVNQNLIIGYVPENKKQYKMIVDYYKKSILVYLRYTKRFILYLKQ